MAAVSSVWRGGEWWNEQNKGSTNSPRNMQITFYGGDKNTVILSHAFSYSQYQCLTSVSCGMNAIIAILTVYILFVVLYNHYKYNFTFFLKIKYFSILVAPFWSYLITVSFKQFLLTSQYDIILNFLDLFITCLK